MSVEIHTSKGASWSDGSEASFVSAIKVKAKTLTGAGDSWDSANILAHLLVHETRIQEYNIGYLMALFDSKFIYIFTVASFNTIT